MASREARNLLDQLDLSKWYPSKITLADIMGADCALTIKSPADLPWIILQKLVMIDYRSRESELETLAEVMLGTPQPKSDDDGFDFDFETTSKVSDAMNPVDVLLVIFNCCNLQLKQVLAQKMNMCRLAIPFLYPDLSAGKKLLQSVWAFRGVVIEWQDMNNTAQEAAITDANLNIVTFIRIGRPEISKSKLMNEVLSDKVHSAFFHSDCSQGDTAKTVSNGLVEASCFLPSGKGSTFDNATMFLNLRGDATDFDNQLNVLQSFSSVVVIVVDVSIFESKPSVSKILSVAKKSTSTILLVTCSYPNQKKIATFKDQFTTLVSEKERQMLRLVLGFTANGAKSAYQLKMDVRESIAKNGKTCHSFEDLNSFMGKSGISSDEEDANCKKGKYLAEQVQKQMETETKQRPIEIFKRELFNLQDEAWMKWSQTQKHLYRSRNIPLEERQKLRDDLASIRNKQLERCDKIPKFMNTFIKNLSDNQGSHVSMFFIRWLKMYLDKKSREVLPKLHQEYQRKWADLREEKDKKQADQNKVEELSMSVFDVEKKLSNASIGIEHMLREMGQKYEAVKESREVVKHRDVERLPAVAAELFMSGYPIEIMNGESASIPLTWIEAVLNRVHDKLNGAKMFVLSILGVQSSGKSTFLNSMFGLEFAVSAGRCTRGASIQLVPLTKGNTSLPYDYVIVLDTEGLRAPELGFQKHDRDNELATMAIGMADIALMNIKGENYADINDILQIAVQGFLRMHSVSSDQEQRRKCAFVHQNVPDVNAKYKLAEGLRKLQKSLDALTAEAAKLEGKEHIRTFSQVIDFDGEKHVWYLSDLWHGDPPMAPANPGYSEKVKTVKSSIIYDMAKQRKTYTVMEIAKRLSDLWKAVLTENFVFNFRNSLAVQAYRTVESKVLELCWAFEKQMEDFIRHDATRRMKECLNAAALKKVGTALHNELRDASISNKEHMRKELNDFIATSRHNDIMVQWQEEKLISLNLLCDKVEQKMTSQFIQKLERQKLDISQVEQQDKLQKDIMNKANRLAEELRGTMPGELAMKNKFEQLWKPLQDELGRNAKTGIQDLTSLMDKVLHEVLFDSVPLLQNVLKKKPLGSWQPGKALSQSITIDDINPQEHLAAKETQQSGTTKTQIHQMVPAVISDINGMFLEVELFLRGLGVDEINFETYAQNIIRIIMDQVEKINDSDDATCPYRIQKTLTVKLVVYACCYSIEKFNNTQGEYFMKHSVQSKLQGMKDTLFSMFKHNVKESTSEVKATELINKEIEEMVHSTVSKEMAVRIVGDVLRHFSFSKYNFITCLLEALAKQADFQDYLMYLRDASSFAKKWLQKHIEEEYFDKGKYQALAKTAIDSYFNTLATDLDGVGEILEKEEQSSLDLQAWLDMLYFKSRDNIYENELELPMDKFKSLNAKDMQLANPVRFTNAVQKQLGNMPNIVYEKFKKVTKKNVEWKDGKSPFIMVFEKIWGCTDQCKFCHEPCMKASDHTRSDHQCLQHRPQGVIGIRNSRTSVMELNSCNSLVTSNATFSCQRVSPKCTAVGHEGNLTKRHPYREYKSYMRGWDIAPDHEGQSNLYWQWFVVKFQSELKARFKYNLPLFSIPWNGITREEAIQSLKQL